jgi:HD-GYP domain-containing protein (c-di-GMP phosphodiesterase class II)
MTLQHDNPVASASAIDALQIVFGTEFEPFQSDGPSAQEASELKRDDAPVQITSIDATHWQVVLSDFGPIALTGTVQAVDEESIVRLVDAAQEIISQRQAVDSLNEELGYFVEQVSGDLEEACWFRKLAEQVAACRADEPMVQLCSRILPKLRQLLYAQSVLVLHETDVNLPPELIAADAEANGPWQARALHLLHQFRETAQQGAIVRNAGFPTEADQQMPDSVNAFVLVRIGTARQHFGWLIAMGRDEGHGEYGQSRRSESEFGTHEATLMETAAVLLATHAGNCELFEEQEKTLVGVVTAMVNALDARDPYTRGHSHRVAMISERLAREIGLSDEQCEDIYLTGLLHDIGKIGVADQVLLKNGALDADERRQIEQHTVIGHSILSPVKQLDKVLPGVLHHHEKIDGTGYPQRLAGERIPLAGRILAVADAFDAMTTSRPYRNAMPIVQAVQILLEGTGTHWDEVIIDAFFRSLSDIHRIYDKYNADKSAAQESLLQFGRFEDLSLGRVDTLASLAGPAGDS